MDYEFLNLFNHGFETMAKTFLITQPIFLLGAVLFRRLHFFNTILWLNIIGFGLTIITFIFMVIIFHPLPSMEGDMFNIPGFEEYLEERFLPTLKFLYHYIIPPFFMVTAYFKLKEVEIS